MHGKAFRKDLIGWYARYSRVLPWRSKPTPYRVWVSEVMLQQTRVEVVREYFIRFMKRFPSLRKLANAEIDDVLEAWSGLGYYRRARSLHAAAKLIVDNHSGRFPKDRTDALGLPGVGEYTAGAVLSIAFDKPEPIVDGNVERVFSRLYRVSQNVKTGPGRKRMWQLAGKHVRQGTEEGHAPSALNQALMELGATICVSKTPACRECPVNSHCGAKAAGDVRKYPALPHRSKSKERRYLFVAVRDNRGRLLMTRRGKDDKTSLLPNGMWELPHVEWPANVKRAPLGALRSRYGMSFNATRGELSCKHSIMDYRLQLIARNASPSGAPGGDMTWFSPEEALQLAQASATRKLLAALAGNGR